jgi:uncharacterized alpha-E superfamily protein
MLSRVAESIYWMARYIERAENTARLITVNTNLLLDTPKGISPGWEPLIMITGSQKIFTKVYGTADERNVLKFMIGDLNSPSSIAFSLSNARENARTFRDIIPREAWELINDLYLFSKKNLASGLSQRGRFEYLRHIVNSSQHLTGLLAGSMIHDAGYDFLRIGRNLERADMTIRIVDVRSASLLPDQTGLTPFENIQWMSVLKSLSGYQMYRRHMQVRVQRPQVLKFLLQTAEFPRSFYHCVCAADDCLQHLPRNEALLRLIASIKRLVQNADVGGLQQMELHKFIDDLELPLGDLHAQIAATYFSISPTAAATGG